MKRIFVAIKSFIMYQYLYFKKRSSLRDDKEIKEIIQYCGESPVWLNFIAWLIRTPHSYYKHWKFNNRWKRNHGWKYIYGEWPSYKILVDLRNSCRKGGSYYSYYFGKEAV